MRLYSSSGPRAFLVLFLLASVPPAAGQQHPGSARDAALGLRFEELRFEPPTVQRKTLSPGIEVLFLEDHSLPLVSLYARFEGGYALLPREFYAAATALPGLLRSGGTKTLSPDSVDNLIDFYALQTAFGGGGESTFSSLNTLTKHLGPAVELWQELLRSPRFDPDEVEVWRGRQTEGTRRRRDSPGALAFSEFNRLMFGDHPIGWDLEEKDLTPERLSPETLATVHSKIFCPEHLILGAVGDAEWDTLEPLFERMVEDWPACPEPLDEPQVPEMRREGGVFLIPKDLSQSTVVMAEPGGIAQGASEDYFASRIGNLILGASGFSSRLVSRVRTEKGWAYSASSLWTTPAEFEGIVGAVTQTKSESTIAAVRLILQIMEEMRDAPPKKEEVDHAINQIVNGFVFNFQEPAQILSRQMFYLAQGLPEDWLEQYLEGIQRVSPRSVQRVFQRHVHPQDMVILILGDPEHFDFPPETLGLVQIWEVEGVTGSPVEGGSRNDSPLPDRPRAP
jgi:predicted Zn-dependent peptidase